MMFRAGRVALCGVVTAATLCAQSDNSAPALRIATPAAGSLIVGDTTFEAVVVPEGLRVDSIAFFIDGMPSPTCTATVSPFRCTGNVGETISRHTIRAVAGLPDGRRVTGSVVTAGGVTETVETTAVLVPVVVTDYLGRFVKGLTQASFRIFEDATPQTITFLDTENVPLDLVIAVDVSNSMTPSMPQLKNAVKTFLISVDGLKRKNSRASVTLIAFNDRAFVISKRDSQLADQLSAIDRLTAFGGTSLYDAILNAIALLGNDISRKAIVVFTDGADRSSLSAVDPVISKLRESTATVYMITQGSSAEAEAVRRVVGRLADASGGRVFSIERVDKLQGVLEDIIEDLSNQYLMGYSPTNIVKDGSLRRITVKTNVNSHQIRAREAYRAPSK